jgi:hypothetical protein
VTLDAATTAGWRVLPAAKAPQRTGGLVPQHFCPQEKGAGRWWSTPVNANAFTGQEGASSPRKKIGNGSGQCRGFA